MEGRFGRYRFGRLIGSGGMGDVYEALDVERDRAVALKLLPELFAGNAEFVERFRRESRLAARLRDPHIIPIHDYGEIDGRLFIDMRLVDDGVTLAHLLRDTGGLPPERAVALIGQVAEALDAAHADGLVHRDVKPSNVLVTARDFAYVVDFGIAHAAGHTAAGLTGTGSTIGTLDYMAPERFTSRSSDARVDVYALGCLLFQCLTGRPPFTGDGLPALMYAHLDLVPPRPSEHRPWLPAALDDVVAVAMAKAPDDRFPTTGALAAAARAAIAPTTAGPPERPAPAPSPPDPPREPRPVVGNGPARTEPEPDPEPTTRRETPPAPDEPPRDGTTVHVGPDSHPAALRGRPAILALVAALVVVVAVVAVVVTVGRTGAVPAAATVPPSAAAQLVSLPRPEVVGAIPTASTPGFLAVAPDGRTGYLTNRDARMVSVVDLDRRTVVTTIPLPVATPRFAAVAADGSRVFVSAYDRSGDVVHVVDTASNTVAATIPVDREPYALAVSPDQRSLWVPSHATGSVDVVDLATNTVARRVPVAPNPHWVAFGPRGIYVANHESNLTTALGLDGTTRSQVPVGRSPHALAVSPDGTRVAVVNYDAGTLDVLDADADRVVATVPVGRGPQHVSYAADGRHLYTANVNEGTVSVVDTATTTVTATVTACGSPTSVTPRGAEVLVTCLDDARLVVLRAAA